MKQFIVFLVFAATTCLVSCNDITLNCAFKTSIFKSTPRSYDCFIESLTFSAADKVVAVTGDHEDGKTNDDVTGFVAIGSGIEVFPRGLENVFPNLLIVSLQGSSIPTVNADDFKAFPNLRDLEIYSGELETITADSFKYNKNLEWLDMSSNKLRSIDIKAFQGLDKLKALFLYKNVCIDEYPAGSRDRVLELIEKVGQKC
ncbi:unnamed protein product [Chironomus riparius]|uniref:Uncharacterized protein n=1 Tax=Chironomus riparius TaxID=315576 RepID=A0A9N9WZ54_9DIPT|nr:unnamed protein product [Chironomus riparius]